MKVFITKYALTQGIFEIDAKDHGGGMISMVDAQYPTNYHKPDWHLTYEEALADARTRRNAKIASLEKQIAKLEELTFG